MEGVDEVFVLIFRKFGKGMVGVRADDYGVPVIDLADFLDQLALKLVPVILPPVSVRLVLKLIDDLARTVLAVLGHLTPHGFHEALGMVVGIFCDIAPLVVIDDDCDSPFLAEVKQFVETAEELVLKLVGSAARRLDETSEGHRDAHDVDSELGQVLEGVVVDVAHPDVVSVAPFGNVEARGQVHSPGEAGLDQLVVRPRLRRLDAVEVPGAAHDGKQRQKRKHYFLYSVHIHSFNGIVSFSVK